MGTRVATRRRNVTLTLFVLHAPNRCYPIGRCGQGTLLHLFVRQLVLGKALVPNAAQQGGPQASRYRCFLSSPLIFCPPFGHLHAVSRSI